MSTIQQLKNFIRHGKTDANSSSFSAPSLNPPTCQLLPSLHLLLSTPARPLAYKIALSSSHPPLLVQLAHSTGACLAFVSLSPLHHHHYHHQFLPEDNDSNQCKLVCTNSYHHMLTYHTRQASQGKRRRPKEIRQSASTGPVAPGPSAEQGHGSLRTRIRRRSSTNTRTSRRIFDCARREREPSCSRRWRGRESQRGPAGSARRQQQEGPD